MAKVGKNVGNSSASVKWDSYEAPELICHYREKFPGRTRNEVRIMDTRFYAALREKGVLKQIPNQRDILSEFDGTIPKSRLSECATIYNNIDPKARRKRGLTLGYFIREMNPVDHKQVQVDMYAAKEFIYDLMVDSDLLF